MTQTKYTKKRKVRKVSKSKKYTKKGGGFLNKLRKRRQIIRENEKEQRRLRQLAREQSQPPIKVDTLFNENIESLVKKVPINEGLFELFKGFINNPEKSSAIKLLYSLYKDKNISHIINKIKNPEYEVPDNLKKNSVITKDSSEVICSIISRDIKKNQSSEIIKNQSSEIIKDALNGNEFAFFLGLMCSKDFFSNFFL